VVFRGCFDLFTLKSGLLEAGPVFAALPGTASSITKPESFTIMILSNMTGIVKEFPSELAADSGKPLYLNKVLDALGPVQEITNGWRVSCPCSTHGEDGKDHHPSLSVSVGEAGKILTHCHAGCKLEDILASIGLVEKDLFSPPGQRPVGALAGPRKANEPTEDELKAWNSEHRKILDNLGLEELHMKQLLARGLSEARIRTNGYRSKCCKPCKDSIDGQHYQGEGRLLIPVRNLNGQVVSIKARHDNTEGSERYKYFTSGRGAPTHCPLNPPEKPNAVRVTEGELKADVATALSDTYSIGVAGVSTWRHALPVLEKLKPEKVVVAYDWPDLLRKPQVFQQFNAFVAELTPAGYRVEVEVWNPRASKGVDDVLAAKQKVTRVELCRVIEYLRNRHGVSENAVGVNKGPEATGEPEGRKRRGLHLAELFTLPDPEWLIDRHVCKKGFAVLAAPSGAGKTFIALDYALCVAKGLPYLGKYPVKCGPVVYVVSEGLSGIKQRIKAWMKFNEQIDIPKNIVIVPSSFSFLTDDAHKGLGVVIEKDLQASPVLMVIDTLARNFLGGDENTSKDMGKFVSTVDYFRDHYGASVLAIHHTGVGEKMRERGSSALRGACDTMVILEWKKHHRCCVVHCEKQKDAEEFPPYVLRQEKVDLGDHGSLVYVEGDGHLIADHTRTGTPNKYHLALRKVFGSGEFSAADAVALKIGKKATIYRNLNVLRDDGLIIKKGDKYCCQAG